MKGGHVDGVGQAQEVKRQEGRERLVHMDDVSWRRRFTFGASRRERATRATEPLAGTPTARPMGTTFSSGLWLEGRDEGAAIHTSWPSPTKLSLRWEMWLLTPPGTAKS
jgi:hypothetical protein